MRSSVSCASRRDELQAKYDIASCSNREAAAFGHSSAAKSIVILAVKPQRLGAILSELKGILEPNQLVLSIVAGAKLETIAGALLHSLVVRAMPNTPAQIGQGMTTWITTPEIGEAQQEQVRALLGALGHELRVEEEKMIDMATALSATGPTYIFLVMEALVDAGVHLGFSRHVSQEVVSQTMLGSVLFALDSHKHPAELRNMVTSPGGTSAEAIYQMEKGSLRPCFPSGVGCLSTYCARNKTELAVAFDLWPLSFYLSVVVVSCPLSELAAKVVQSHGHGQ